MNTKQTIEDIKSIYDGLKETERCVEVLKKVRKRSKLANKKHISDGEIELMEDEFIKEESEKIGLDYKLVYTLDIKILKKYLHI